MVGISLDDFCRLRFEEIDEILKAWSGIHNGVMHDRWEMMRLHTFMLLSPFCKELPEPRNLLPLPWEDSGEEPEAPMTEEEKESVFEEQKRRLGWG